MAIHRFLINECLFLLLGAGAALLPAIAARGRGAANPGFVLLVAIILCLFRAGLARRPNPELASGRRIGSQVLLAFALVLLMFFEVGVGMIASAKAPIVVWLVVALLGAAYLTLSFAAYGLAGHFEWPEGDDEFFQDYENWDQP